MRRSSFPIASGLAALAILGASGAEASMARLAQPLRDDGKLVQQVHSVYQAEATLHRRGYYDVRLERPTLPYSFSACKRGVRYHVHVNYYGDLVQVDPQGSCKGYAYGYSSRRSYDDGRYYDRRYYDRPRYDRYRYRYRD